MVGYGPNWPGSPWGTQLQIQGQEPIFSSVGWLDIHVFPARAREM